MSNPFVKAEHKVLFNKDLHPLSRFILISLKYFDRGKGKGCFAKKETIAKMIGISLHQLRNGLKELAEKDYICIEKHGQGKADTIWVIEEVEELETEKIEASTSIIEEEKSNKRADLPLEKVKEEKQPDTATSCLTPAAAEDTPIDLKATKTCHERLQEHLGYEKWQSFFTDAFVSEENASQITLVVPNPVIYDFVCKFYTDKLALALGKEVKIIRGQASNAFSFAQ